MAEDSEFIDSILIATSDIKNVVKRFDKFRAMLGEILDKSQKQERCFTYSFKEKLFNNNSICAICNQKIHNIDDAAVDHIKQYWMGGQTIPENARLTHRFCNWSRPRRENLDSN